MITINWITKVIFVPQAYLTSIGGGVFELDTNQFRLDLKDLEDDADGMTFLDTHRHNTEVTLAGVTYARFFEIINGYTIEFEDLPYAVNLIGTNNNIADVAVVNQVSIRSFNSAGLAVGGGLVATPAQVAAAVLDALVNDHQLAGTFGEAFGRGGLR